MARMPFHRREEVVSCSAAAVSDVERKRRARAQDYGRKEGEMRDDIYIYIYTEYVNEKRVRRRRNIDNNNNTGIKMNRRIKGSDRTRGHE